MRSKGLVAALLAAALVAAGCGSRATSEQKALARGRYVQAGAGSQPASRSAAGGDANATGGDVAPLSGDATTATGNGSEDSGGATAAGTPASGGGGAQNAAAAVPEGGNGGATDVGVTADTITLGNVSTLSGPVPGIFQGAVIGTQAFVAYQNSVGGIFGRKLKLDVRDDQFDAGQNRAQTADLTGKVFALLGSFSLYDDAGLDAMKKGNVPDVGYSLSEARRAFANNFSPQPAVPGWRLGGLQYLKSKFPDAVKAVATIHSDVASAAKTHADMRKAAESIGYKFVYDRAIGATETDFTADVVRMRQNGAKMVYISAVDVKTTARLAKAMNQQGFKPAPFAVGGVAYDPALMGLAGDTVEGLVNEQQQAMFAGEDAGVIPEVALFNQWLQKVKPGYKPDVFAVFAWGAGRLFAQALQAAGPKATRAGLLDALRKIDNFDANGILAPGGPASKRPPSCYIVTQIKGGKFVRLDSPGGKFRCDAGFFRA